MEINTCPRLRLIDTLRGFTIISMILYHGSWDIIHFFGKPLPISPEFDHIWQQSICMTFILISGFCTGLGRHTLRRGLTVLCGALAIFTVTFFFDRNNMIFFGILTLIGVSMLMEAAAEKMIPREMKELPKPVYACFAGIFLLLFIMSYRINKGIIAGIALPAQLYKGYFATFLGFTDPDFHTFDYFPLMPWSFLFFTGRMLCGALKDNSTFVKLCSHHIPFLSFIGKHSLIIYLLHQPVVYGILWLIFNI
ncbi:MAG: DUF1624 domain-containing protein [Huintestinicola sp.]